MPASAVVGLAPSPEKLYAYEFSGWKHCVVEQCFPQYSVVFVSNLSQVPEGACLAVWGIPSVAISAAGKWKIFQLEDGFLRSVGLGADLIRPLSWVVDPHGIYYDATRPSRLEMLLAETVFDSPLLQRAAALRQKIVSGGLSKYNIGTQSWRPPREALGKRLVLVPGQVESDASLAFGAPGIRRNLDLLQAVRRANPDAYIVYKPHPDVVAGLRAAGSGEADVGAWCDVQLAQVPVDVVLDTVDEVHVMTSLAGFEALLRHKRVVCYGQPFFSGWGLTQDMMPHPRRGRTLVLDALVAAALILYPLYFHRQGGALCSPEVAVDELLAWRQASGGGVPLWRKFFRMVLRRVVGVR